MSPIMGMAMCTRYLHIAKYISGSPRERYWSDLVGMAGKVDGRWYSWTRNGMVALEFTSSYYFLSHSMWKLESVWQIE